MLPKIEKARQARASMALQVQSFAPAVSGDSPLVSPKLNEDYGDTVPSRPHNIGLAVTNEVLAASTFKKQDTSDGVELAGEGDFRTVVVHGGDEIGNIANQTQVSESEESTRALGHVESSISGTVVISTEPWVESTVGVAANNILVGESHPAHSMQTSSPLILGSPEQNLKLNSVSQAQVGGGSGASGSPMKNETVSRKAFALQDKLWSIYAAGNTVPIPFLRATDISPIALLSDNVLGGAQRDDSGAVAVEALQELFTGDGQSKKGRRGQNEMPLPPSVHQRLTSSSTLLNLAQALAYHKMCYEEMPLQELQAAQEQQTIQNLCDTLRTILRL